MKREESMEWLCNCDRPVTTLEILWKWREAAAIGHQRGRFVSYRCRIGCDNCASAGEHGNKDCQYFRVRLTARNKRILVRQILAEIVDKARDYVPKTDLQAALRDVHKTHPPKQVLGGENSTEPSTTPRELR